MSWEATAAAKKQKAGSPTAKVVLLCLADACNSHSTVAYPSQQRLADECEMSIRSVRNHLKELERKKLIRVKPRRDDGGHRSSNAYELLFLPAESAAGEQSLPATEGKPTGNCLPHSEPKEEPKGLYSGKSKDDPIKQSFLDSIWKPYPDKTNNDRKRALAVWRKMAPADRQTAIGSIPVYSAYCKANPWYRPLHVERYLRGRYEAHLPTANEAETNPFLDKYGLAPDTPRMEAAE